MEKLKTNLMFLGFEVFPLFCLILEFVSYTEIGRRKNGTIKLFFYGKKKLTLLCVMESPEKSIIYLNDNKTGSRDSHFRKRYHHGK